MIRDFKLMSQLRAFWKHSVLCFRASRVTAKRRAHSASWQQKSCIFWKRKWFKVFPPSVVCGFSGERDIRRPGSKKKACRECPGQVPIPGSLGEGRIEIRRDTFSLAQMGKVLWPNSTNSQSVPSRYLQCILTVLLCDALLPFFSTG